MKYLRAIFDDWLTRAAGIMLLLIMAFVAFGVFSPLPFIYPFVGLFVYGMVIVLFIAGGIIFALAMLRS